MEMAKKPKTVATVATLSSRPPPAEVVKDAEDDRKIAAQPKYCGSAKSGHNRGSICGAGSREKKEHVEESSLKASAPSLVKKADHVEEGKEGGDGQ